MRTNETAETEDALSAAAPFPGESAPMLMMRSCPHCGIETTEMVCFVCGKQTLDQATYEWLTSPNPSGSEC